MRPRRLRTKRDRGRPALAEKLERRTLLAAIINWTNRGTATSAGAGDSDHFGQIFGTTAPAARTVVDTVIAQYEVMIGNFNYSDSSRQYNVQISMSTTDGGFIGNAFLDDDLDGKPDAGHIIINFGQLTPDPNDANSWFIDPTPSDSSEFSGNIINAFTGVASSGPASGHSDFYSTVAAELTHVLGQMGSQLDDWANLTTNTGADDQVLAPGKLWVFRGPDIKHLLTSDNAGTTDTGAAYHTAEPQSLFFGGDTYVGTDDAGNAQTSAGTRTLPDNIHALMFKDAFGYSTVNPAKFGTFYANLNRTTHQLIVRGGDFTAGMSPSNDFIDISASGGLLTVSVDIGNDVPGSGALPGAGNLPAFVSQFTSADVTSIVVNAGGGNDQIVVDSLPAGMPATLEGGEGNDTITIGGGDYDFNIKSPIDVEGDLGVPLASTNDQVVINDFLDNFGNNNYDVDGLQFYKPGTQHVTMESDVDGEQVYCSANNDQVNILAATASLPVTVDGGNGNDQFYFSNGDFSTVLGQVSINGNNGTDALFAIDDSNAADHFYTLSNTSMSSNGVVLFWNSTMESFTLTGSTGNNLITFYTGPGNIPMTLNGNSGNDTFTTDPLNYSAANTSAAIVLNGGAGTDSFNINDSLTNPYTVTVNSSTISRSFSPAYNFSQMEGVTWNGGGGNDTYLISTTDAATPVSLNGGSGNDLFENGGPGTFLELFDLNGNVTINGGSGTNTLLANDNDSPTNHTYTLTANTVKSDTSATISYSNITTMLFTASQYPNTININGTNPGTNMIVDSNVGNDTVNVNATASGSGVGTYVTLRGGSPPDAVAAGDTINVNADGVGTAVAHLDASQVVAALNILTGGTMVLESAGNRAVKTKNFNPTGTGALDITNNGAIIDYTGTSNLGTWNGSAYTGVTGFVASGRNGGSWNGKGIGTSSASGALKVLGVGEASSVLGITGAQTKLYYGVTADSTSVLVKYTYGGDATLDGKLNIDDYVKIDTGIASGLTGWANGDFNYDGKVNIDDYVIIDTNLPIQGPPIANASSVSTAWVSAPSPIWPDANNSENGENDRVGELANLLS